LLQKINKRWYRKAKLNYQSGRERNEYSVKTFLVKCVKCRNSWKAGWVEWNWKLGAGGGRGLVRFHPWMVGFHCLNGCAWLFTPGLQMIIPAKRTWSATGSTTCPWYYNHLRLVWEKEGNKERMLLSKLLKQFESHFCKCQEDSLTAVLLVGIDTNSQV
jgi:hypothetical protein